MFHVPWEAIQTLGLSMISFFVHMKGQKVNIPESATKWERAAAMLGNMVIDAKTTVDDQIFEQAIAEGLTVEEARRIKALKPPLIERAEYDALVLFIAHIYVSDQNKGPERAAAVLRMLLAISADEAELVANLRDGRYLEEDTSKRETPLKKIGRVWEQHGDMAIEFAKSLGAPASAPFIAVRELGSAFETALNTPDANGLTALDRAKARVKEAKEKQQNYKDSKES